jgi:outer membrane protein TolC
VPITLESVFRLAEAQNPRIAQAREKLNESLLTQEMNSRCWLPDVYAGLAYYRHEGGIQGFDGRLIHSSTGALVPGLNIQSEIDLREATFRALNEERLIWQDKGEKARIDNEVLLEAASTYIDFLTARRGLALAEEIEKSERKLMDRAEKMAKSDAAATAFAESMRAAMAGRQQTIAKLRQQGNAAMAKLVQLLGLPPHTVLVPQDLAVVPFELVDLSPATEALVERAMQAGPGVRELSGLLAVIQTGLDKSYGLHNLLPTMQLCLFEGALGAGPGGSLSWDNRLDVGVNLRWNLTELTRTEYNRQRARLRQAQAMFALQDLQGKLALGVQEGKDTVLHSREQIGLASAQIKHASESYRLSETRLDKAAPGASAIEVMLAIRSLEQAHFNHLLGIAGHNKAQVRLLLLLGPSAQLAPPRPLPPGP